MEGGVPCPARHVSLPHLPQEFFAPSFCYFYSSSSSVSRFVGKLCTPCACYRRIRQRPGWMQRLWSPVPTVQSPCGNTRHIVLLIYPDFTRRRGVVFKNNKFNSFMPACPCFMVILTSPPHGAGKHSQFISLCLAGIFLFLYT